MAHYLGTLDATARYISVPTVTLVGDFTIEWKGAAITNGVFVFAGASGAGTNGIDLYRNGSGKYQLFINTQSQIVSTVNASNSAASPDIVRIKRVGSTFTMSVNGVSQGSVSLTPLEIKILRIFHRDGWATYGNQALYSLTITGSDPRNYDANASGGTGNILPETISALNGTQAGTWPADNSEWVFYSAGGTAPTGTVTIGTITPNSTGASVPFTYSASDQTGFEYRINGGAAVTGTNSPQVLTGLTTSTAYTIEIRAINASGQGTWSAPANFTTLASGSAPSGTFTVGTITTTQTTASVPYTYSAADFDSIEYRIDGGTPVTASASPQSLTGLTSATTYGIEFRAVNAFGNGAWSTSSPFTTAAVPTGTITLAGLSDNTATLWSDLSDISCTVMNEAATSVVVTKTGLTANAVGTVTFNDAAITAGTWYTVVIVSGTNRGIIRIQAT